MKSSVFHVETADKETRERTERRRKSLRMSRDRQRCREFSCSFQDNFWRFLVAERTSSGTREASLRSFLCPRIRLVSSSISTLYGYVDPYVCGRVRVRKYFFLASRRACEELDRCKNLLPHSSHASESLFIDLRSGREERGRSSRVQRRASDTNACTGRRDSCERSRRRKEFFTVRFFFSACLAGIELAFHESVYSLSFE